MFEVTKFLKLKPSIFVQTAQKGFGLLCMRAMSPLKISNKALRECRDKAAWRIYVLTPLMLKGSPNVSWILLLRNTEEAVSSNTEREGECHSL